MTTTNPISDLPGLLADTLGHVSIGARRSHREGMVEITMHESTAVALAEFLATRPEPARSEPAILFGEDVNPVFLMDSLPLGMVVDVLTKPNPGNTATTVAVWDGCDRNGITVTVLADEDELDAYSADDTRPDRDPWRLTWPQVQGIVIH